MAQFEFLLWLVDWYLRTNNFVFEWDDGNSKKSLEKHDIGTDEIESLFNLRLGVPLGNQVAPLVPENRYCIVGPSQSGNIISVVFTLRNDRVRPISGRPASRKERDLYEEIGEALKRI